MLSKTFLTLLFLYFFRTEVYTQNLVFPEKNLYATVLIEVPGRFPASGFYYRDYNHNIFLVTAKHVLLDSLNNPWASTYTLSSPIFPRYDTLIQLEIDPFRLKKDNELLFLDSVDMAIIRIAESVDSTNSILYSYGVIPKFKYFQIISAVPSGLKMYEKNQISTEVFLVGYPSSLELKNFPQFNHEFPLIRKGIIAGKYDLYKTLIIDSPVYYGNSGSPVFEFLEDARGYDLKLIGIASQFIPFDQHWVNQQIIPPDIFLINSGYSVVIPVDNLLLLTSKFE